MNILYEKRYKMYWQCNVSNSQNETNRYATPVVVNTHTNINLRGDIDLCVLYIYIYIYCVLGQQIVILVRGAYDKFLYFFRMGTFIDCTHMKL